ncbi:MAG TPA: FliA/WhiG family RNA polymerase sigma factor [Ktedonobacteraceae bacterium]
MNVSAIVRDNWIEFSATRRQDLRDWLVIEYTPLVRFVVGRLGLPPTSLLDAEDFVSYGMIGLLNAIDRFDPTRGVRFEVFATPRIRGAVIDQLRVLNWLPRSSVSRLRLIENTLSSLLHRLGRPATDEEVAAEMGVTAERYRQMLFEVSTTILSLDAPLSAIMLDDDYNSLGTLLEDRETPTPADLVERKELARALADAINNLPEREQLLLSLYYTEELTMKEISKIMGVSESRICQLHIQAILRLRGTLQEFRTDDVKYKAHQKEKNRGKQCKKEVSGKKGAQAVVSSRSQAAQRVS